VTNRLTALSEGVVTTDGKLMRVKIETETSPPFELEIPHEAFGDLIQYLAALGMAAAAARQDHEPKDPLRRGDFSPIPADGLGLAMSHTAGNAVLMVRAGGIDWPFDCPATRLVELLRSPELAALASGTAMESRIPS